MFDFIEKRRYSRIGAHVPIQYKELHGGSPITGAVTKDLSEGGIKFYTHKFISLACRMIVELNLPAIEKNIKAISKVAWIKKLPAGDDYEVGNQFLDMTKEDKQTISGYVKKFLESTDSE